LTFSIPCKIIILHSNFVFPALPAGSLTVALLCCFQKPLLGYKSITFRLKTKSQDEFYI
jgi:hypothetical protein